LIHSKIRKASEEEKDLAPLQAEVLPVERPSHDDVDVIE